LLSETLTLVNKTQVFRCKWQFNITISFLHISHKTRNRITSWCIPSLSKSPPLSYSQKVTLPVTHLCQRLPSSMLSMNCLRSSIKIYSQAISWHSTHLRILTEVTLPAQQSLYLKEEILTRKSFYFKELRKLTVSHCDHSHGLNRPMF